MLLTYIIRLSSYSTLSHDADCLVFCLVQMSAAVKIVNQDGLACNANASNLRSAVEECSHGTEEKFHKLSQVRLLR